MPMIAFRDAIREALIEEMERDREVFLMGEDIQLWGGPFRITEGMTARFGKDRVLDMPISESAFVGAAMGAALMGMRPVVELMFSDFLPLVMDQLVNHAAKMRYSYSGGASVPMVLRAPFGAGTSSGLQHSQSLEAWVMHSPGLKVVMPATPADAKGLLKTAIRDDDPVVYLEHRLLYATKGEVPPGEYTVPLGKAAIPREGSDVTVVATGMMVHKALEAAAQLEKEGVAVEVIDLRTLLPLDEETIIQSVSKTGKLLIVHEACRTGGMAGEIAAVVAKEAFGYLDAPIERITAPDTPVPFSAPLEKFFIPQTPEIVGRIRKMVS
jgi:pyruvate/2-oxoglutarate/acetoin dehydrogenase E1 component